jgi:hypothetical protein
MSTRCLGAGLEVCIGTTVYGSVLDALQWRFWGLGYDTSAFMASLMGGWIWVWGYGWYTETLVTMRYGTREEN